MQVRRLMRRRALLIPLALATGVVSQAARAEPQLTFGAPFADHAVLQRDKPIALWGKAVPGATVTIALDATTVTAMADAKGEWHATLPAHPAGGPYRLTVRASGATRTLSDILVGDVWLCSGQSNMEYSVDRALNAKLEIEGSADAGLRFLRVGRTLAPAPARNYPRATVWETASPATTGQMSAVCFFMGQALRKTSRVPIGLIAASWGGTGIDGWRSGDALRREGRANDRLDLLDLYAADAANGLAAWASRWQDWWRGAYHDTPWSADHAPGPDWRAVPSFTRWEDWSDPALASFDGLLWYRTEIVLTAAQARRAEALSIGLADDIDNSWVNGQLVGTTGQGIDGVRQYRLPAGRLRAGRNVIAINVRDLWNWGGLSGPAAERAILLEGGERVPLSGRWLYRAALPAPAGVPTNPWQSVGGLTSLYNGMIAPLHPYGLRGVAWYQGEADSGPDDAPGYAAKLSSLMADWRRQFAMPDLRFVVVQLPEYRAPSTAPQASSWAILREGQRRAVAADANAALVVTLGLGSATDIHPADKKGVGLRAARAANWLETRGSAGPSGPVAVDVRRQGRTVKVHFRDVEQSLAALGSGHVIGFQLCTANGDCHFADASVHDATSVDVIVPELVPLPSMLRFCWADNPQCNLTDASGLPAGPFEITIE